MAEIPTGSNTPPAVRLHNITKTFGSVVANNHIDLDIQAGSVHALLGENGAGKTTLMNILYGLIKPESGKIEIRGQAVEINSPADATDVGIAMVHQQFMLVPRFTVVENIVLGQPTPGGPLLSVNKPVERIKHLSDTYGLKVNPLKEVSKLSVGEQQRVEIIKAFYRNADILILDEPTSVLTPQEVNQLFQVLRLYRDAGHTVIFISHKLNEVLDISDRITVLRDGKVVKTLETSQATRNELARLMVGREISLDFSEKRENPSEQKVLDVEDLWVKNKSGLNALSGISFYLRQGEILAIAGVDGNGQTELAETLLGLLKVTQGKIVLRGKDITGQSPAQAIQRGIAFVPADRRESGMLGSLQVWRNILLGTQSNPPHVRRGFLQNVPIQQKVRRLLKEFDVRPPDPEWIAGSLSGGNQQKLVLARQLDLHPQLLIICQPTLGLDIRTTEYVRRLLLQERQKGTAILLISTDLQEVLSLSDRVMVMFEGKNMGEVLTVDAEVEQLGLMMAGISLSSQKDVVHE